MAAIASAVVAACAIGAIDVFVPFGGLTNGSSSALSPINGLQLTAGDARCTAQQPAPCPAAYTFAPNKDLNAWVTIRNGSTQDMTVDGVDEWLALFMTDTLVRPVA